MNYDSSLSASDVALITGRNGSNGNGFGDAFGGNGAWFIILFLIFSIFGWGRNGFGGNDNRNGGGCGMTYVPYGIGGIGNAYTDSTIQRGFDNQAVINKLNGIENGLADGFYAVNNTLCQGFAGVNQNIMQNGYESRLATQNLSSQLASCCCDLGYKLQDCCCTTQRAIDNINYNLATQSCDTRNTIQNATRDIVDNNNANTRAILDFLTNDKISTLQAENQTLKFQASQTAQNAFITANQEAQTAELIRRLGADCPQPSFIVQPPQPVTFPTNCCGQFTGFNNCNSNCGCY